MTRSGFLILGVALLCALPILGTLVDSARMQPEPVRLGQTHPVPLPYDGPQVRRN